MGEEKMLRTETRKLEESYTELVMGKKPYISFNVENFNVEDTVSYTFEANQIIGELKYEYISNYMMRDINYITYEIFLIEKIREFKLNIIL